MPASILHLLGTAEPEGASVAGMVRTLATHLDPAAYQHAACFLAGAGPWVDRLADAGVATFVVPWRSPLDAVGALAFWRFLRSRSVDLLHVHYGGRSVRRIARAATRAPVVVHLHGRVRNETECTPIRMRLQDVDAVIATSGAVAELAEARHVRVVYPGVGIPLPTAPRDSWTIGAAGRLVPIKGYDRLLDAFAIVYARCPMARLEIAGEGPSRADLERQARSLRLGEAVKFLGWSNDLTTLMARWTVFAQPSLEEALGITVLQAMACGLPVIASHVGGVPEIVAHGEAGLLVPPGNVSALAASLHDLLTHPERGRLLGERGRRRAELFSEPRFVSSIAEIYKQCLRPGLAAVEA